MKRILPIFAVLLLLASCASSGSWMTRPYSVYPEKDYVCAVGHGKTQEDADLNAKVELASLFGLAINSSISRSVTEATSTSGSGQKDFYGEYFTMDASTSVSVENLYGVTIAKRAEQKDGSFCSLAVMEKKTTLEYYRAQRKSVKDQMNSLEKSVKARLSTIGAVRDASELIPLASACNTWTVMCNYLSSKDEDYVLLSTYKELYRKAVDAVVLNVAVEGDESGLVQSAISEVLTDNGFKVNKGDQTPTAEIAVTISWTESKGTGATASFVFAGYSADLSFVDRKDNRAVLVYSAKGREGHQDIASAKTRCIRKLASELETELRKTIEDELTYKEE